jgi:Sec-independent protein translocase protein TatA
MDGIFGVGVGELLIVMLVLFVVGGPKNTAKWARELGGLVRQVRLAWAQVMADMEKELGPEGKELMDTARELGQGVRDVATASPAKQLVSGTMRMVASSTKTPDDATTPDLNTPTTPAGSGNGNDPSEGDAKYRAWLPPENSDN